MNAIPAAALVASPAASASAAAALSLPGAALDPAAAVAVDGGFGDLLGLLGEQAAVVPLESSTDMQSDAAAIVAAPAVAAAPIQPAADTLLSAMLNALSLRMPIEQGVMLQQADAVSDLATTAAIRPAPVLADPEHAARAAQPSALLQPLVQTQGIARAATGLIAVASAAGAMTLISDDGEPAPADAELPQATTGESLRAGSALAAPPPSIPGVVAGFGLPLAAAFAFSEQTPLESPAGAAVAAVAGGSDAAGDAQLPVLTAAVASTIPEAKLDANVLSFATSAASAGPQPHAGTHGPRADGALPPIAAAFGSPQWGNELASRVITMTREQWSEAQIRVTPDELGPIEIKLRFDGDKVHAQFGAVSPEAREALSSNMHRLRELLASEGLNLGQSFVGQQGSGERRAGGGNGFRSAADDADADVPLVSRARSMAARSGLLDEFA